MAAAPPHCENCHRSQCTADVWHVYWTGKNCSCEKLSNDLLIPVLVKHCLLLCSHLSPSHCYHTRIYNCEGSRKGVLASGGPTFTITQKYYCSVTRLSMQSLCCVFVMVQGLKCVSTVSGHTCFDFTYIRVFLQCLQGDTRQIHAVGIPLWKGTTAARLGES